MQVHRFLVSIVSRDDEAPYEVLGRVEHRGELAPHEVPYFGISYLGSCDVDHPDPDPADDEAKDKWHEEAEEALATGLALDRNGTLKLQG